MKNLIKEEIDEIKYLFEYKRGVIISEQPIDVRKVDKSNLPKSDYLGAGGQFQQNYARQTTKSNLDTQSKWLTEFNELKKKYANSIPYEEFYTSTNPIFKEWVISNIKKLKPERFAKIESLPQAIFFFKKYFNSHLKPEIIGKIMTISNKNGYPVSKEKVSQVINELLSSYLPSISFKLDFDYNEKSPRTYAFVYPDKVDGIIYLCALSDLFKNVNEFSSTIIWNETVLHEVGHLVDGFFKSKGIYFHSSDKGKASSSKISSYPHSSLSKSFLDLDTIITDFDEDVEYRTDEKEQFTRFKVLFNALSRKGLKINSTLNEFIDSFIQCLKDEIIIIGYNRCQTRIKNGILTVDKSCISLDSIKSKKDTLSIYVDSYTAASLDWLFSNYTTIKILKPKASFELPTVEYTINLNDMYNDWKNEYVMNIDKKQTQSTATDFPSA